MFQRAETTVRNPNEDLAAVRHHADVEVSIWNIDSLSARLDLDGEHRHQATGHRRSLNLRGKDLPVRRVQRGRRGDRIAVSLESSGRGRSTVPRHVRRMPALGRFCQPVE